MWNLKKYSNRPALTSDAGISLTYDELDCMNVVFAEKIFSSHEKSTRPLVFVLSEKNVETILAYTACIEYHIPVFMLPKNIKEDRLRELIKLYMPEYIWCPKNKSLSKCVYEYGTYTLMLTEYSNVSDKNIACDINQELALLLSTSGTTGSTKTVRISYENIRSNMISIIHALEITYLDITATILPLHYTYGLSIINTYIYSGAEILVTDKNMLDKNFWGFFNEHKGNCISGVTYTYKMLKKSGLLKKKPPYLLSVTQAGERLDEDMYKYLSKTMDKWDVRFYPMYGQTEATARISVMPYKFTNEKTLSVGKVIEGGKIEIQDEGGNIMPAGTEGRIIYYGANVALGYAYGRKDLGLGDTWNKKLDTGDKGYVDEDGFVYILGRDKDFIKIAGNRISLREIEDIVNKKFGECIIKGNQTGDGMEVLCIYDNPEDIVSYLTDQTGISRLCINITVVKGLEETDSGKIKR